MQMPTPYKSKRIINNEKLSPDELSKFMRDNGIGEKELAEIFGVTTQAVKLWVSGAREFSVTNSRLVRLFIKNPKLLTEF